MLTDRPPPIILQGPANQTLAVDGTALLKCKATGDPLPVISWLKEGFTFLGRDPRASIQEQGTLQIKNLRVSHILFMCRSSILPSGKTGINLKSSIIIDYSVFCYRNYFLFIKELN